MRWRVKLRVQRGRFTMDSSMYSSLFASVFLICLSALFSGLTLGLMGLDKVGLQIVIESGQRAEVWCPGTLPRLADCLRLYRLHKIEQTPPHKKYIFARACARADFPQEYPIATVFLICFTLPLLCCTAPFLQLRPCLLSAPFC